MFDPRALNNNVKTPLLLDPYGRDTSNSTVDLETLKLREKVAQLEKEMIDVFVEIETKDSIIDNLQRWKSLLAMLNSPQYSGVSIEINKVKDV
jgi:hypothetical protein